MEPSSAKLKTLYSQQQIAQMVSNVANAVDTHFAGIQTPLIVVGVLKGAWMFHADLVRQLKTDLLIDFIRASSYGHSTTTSGVVRILKDIEVDIRDRDVLVVEEIIDSGRTLKFIRDRLIQGGARSVKIAALLDKKERREVDCEADFVGAVVPNHFVVGYGLDWQERFRNLKEVCIVSD